MRTKLPLIVLVLIPWVNISDAKADDNGSYESDINIVDNDGHTVFHLACLYGNFPVVDYLCTCMWY